MRSSLLNLITKTVVYKYSLPNPALNLYKSEHSTRDDDCYESLDDKKLSEIIYNLIIEYSFNEFEITKNTYENLFKIALQIKLKYDENYDESQKLKLGFYGEVLLYGILYSKYNSKPLISRGYFYSPSENNLEHIVMLHYNPLPSGWHIHQLYEPVVFFVYRIH